MPLHAVPLLFEFYGDLWLWKNSAYFLQAAALSLENKKNDSVTEVATSGERERTEAG